MSLSTETYYYVKCNGKVQNLVQPNCPALAPGALGDETAARTAAEEAGYLRIDGRDYCPQCKGKYAATSTTDPLVTARRTRRPKVEEPQPETWSG